MKRTTREVPYHVNWENFFLYIPIFLKKKYFSLFLDKNRGIKSPNLLFLFFLMESQHPTLVY